MKCFTATRDLSPPLQRRIATMTREEAIEEIREKIQLILPSEQLTNDIWKFWTEKLVLDVLDYCNRPDFPEALIYTCVDLILKRIADAETAASYDEDGLPLSEIKMDDTSFKFSTGLTRSVINSGNVGLLSDSDFDSIKPRLNLYRKPVAL